LWIFLKIDSIYQIKGEFKMTIQTELLPYTKEALQPVLSDQTLFYHYEKHYKTYVNTANTLIAGTELEHLPLVEIIQKAKAEHGKLFNNAAQCYNHVFYFNSLAAETQKPEGKLAEALVRDFGSLKAFEDAMKEAGVSQFGSGWVWLVSDEKGKLSVYQTSRPYIMTNYSGPLKINNEREMRIV